MSWLDGDSLDPDDAEGCAAMMEALLDGERDHGMSVSLTAAAKDDLPPTGTNLHAGFPLLRCSVPWGVALLAEVDPDHSAVRTRSAELRRFREDGIIAVRVDWGHLLMGAAVGLPFRLSVRLRGVCVASASATCPEPLSCEFDVRKAGAVPGETFVAALSWAHGSRHLHVLTPLPPGGLNLTGLVAAPSAAPLTACALFGADARGAVDASSESGPDRGFGVELEMITSAPVPEESGCFTKSAELEAALAPLGASEASGSACPVQRMLRRLRMWTVEVDDHMDVSPHRVAVATVEAERASGGHEPGGEAHASLDPSSPRVTRLLSGEGGVMKSEFKSPPPPRELSFAAGGAAEVAAFVRLLRHMGCGAPALSARAASCSSLHVHVNVRSAS